MEKKFIKFFSIGFIITGILGALSHFVYDWLGKSIIVGFFAPVNESPWEHLKLLFFPFVLFTIFEALYINDKKYNIYFSNLVGITIGTLSTLSIYYLVSGATGKQINWMNILSYYIGLAISFLISYFIAKNSRGKVLPNKPAIIMFIIITFSFMLLTLFPVKIPLFLDQQNNIFGIK